MNADEKNRYFQELSRNLRYEGLTVKPETEEELLPVELDGQRLCLVLETGVVRYWKEDTADDRRSAALDRATDVAKITAEYMRQMEVAPQLTASGLTGDYRLLAEFNDTVLAGHPSKYGIQFVTWEWVQDYTALYQGMRIQYILARAEQDGGLDTALLRQITSAILIFSTGEVSLKLKNGQIMKRSDLT